jgi:hypothetical protein
MYFLLIGFWLGNLTERDRLEDLDKWKGETDLKKLVWGVWTGLVWLRPEKILGLLLTR